MYTRVLIALLAATAVIARPQDDVLDELDPFSDVGEVNGPTVDAGGPELDVSSCKALNDKDCRPGHGCTGMGAKGCAIGLFCDKTPQGDNSQWTCKTGCEDNGDCASQTTNKKCNTDTNQCVECTGSGSSDTCPAGKYCNSGACATGCKTGTFFTSASGTSGSTANCPNAATSGQTAPALCKSDHTCQYSTCDPSATSGALKCTTGTCTKGTNNLYTCVATPAPAPSCNSYKKCPKGSYCHNRKCKDGCDKKYSKCEKANGDKGTCNGNHECIIPLNKKDGFPCRKDTDCSINPLYKCVRDIDHTSHCHKVSAKGGDCDKRSDLFPAVCGKDLVCNERTHKCDEKKKHKNSYHH